MTSAPLPAPDVPNVNEPPRNIELNSYPNENIDLRDLLALLSRGLAATLGLGALGMAIAQGIYLAASPFTSSTTSARVAFSFNGYGKGEYPDQSKFQPDDIRSPDIILEALKRRGLETTGNLPNTVRVALTIEGIVSPNVVKERDRLRAAGQPAVAYIPDEYLLTLTLPRRIPLTNRERELLLNEIVSVYEEQFEQTYADTPMAFGNAFGMLRNADYPDYDLILTEEIQNILEFLRQRTNGIKDDSSTGNSNSARTFRSKSTNLSFSDLLEETRLFSQLRLNEMLGLIYVNGLSRDRATAIMKMDYGLRSLEDQEQKAVEEERLINGLLAKAQERSQNYVLGIKSQATERRAEAPILDQGLVDSLLANDAYNFLVRRSLEAGLVVNRIQAEKARLLGRRANMEGFFKASRENPNGILQLVQKSISDNEVFYNQLISDIRKTSAEFAKRQYADAIRLNMQPTTGSIRKPLAEAGIIGASIGLASGIGISLLGIRIGRRNG